MPMALTLSDYSDLAGVSPRTRMGWEGELSVREKYKRYYTGEIFQSELPREAGLEDDTPLMYPVGINLAKLLCHTLADSLFGEWEEQIITFEPRQDDKVAEAEKDAADLAALILGNSNANSMLWELDLDRNMYGGCALKVQFIGPYPHIRWNRVPMESFFPVWDPEDIDNLLEVYIVSQITPEQARAKYGIEYTKQDYVPVVEHWTTRHYTYTVGDSKIQAYSGINPYGFVPFVFIPRIRSTHWWGDSLIEDIIPTQDELNMRIADMGEAINYNAHPVKWGLNLPKSFNSKNFPIGPNVLWDLGRVIGPSPEPKVGILEANNPIPDGAWNFITFLYDWTTTSSFAPPVVLGGDAGGTQRSGITVELRMWPLVRAIRRSRSYMTTGLMRAIRYSAMILRQKNIDRVPKRALERLIDGSLMPRYAPVLPRDQASIVDEITKDLSNPVPTISLETAVKKLGYGTGEVERIKDMIGDASLTDWKKPAIEPKAPDSGAGNAPKKEPNVE
jgi:hypothetical protein